MFKDSTQVILKTLTVGLGITAVGKRDLITTRRKNKNLQPKRKVPRTLGDGWKITNGTHHRARGPLTSLVKLDSCWRQTRVPRHPLRGGREWETWLGIKGCHVWVRGGGWSWLSRSLAKIEQCREELRQPEVRTWDEGSPHLDRLGLGEHLHWWAATVETPWVCGRKLHLCANSISATYERYDI